MLLYSIILDKSSVLTLLSITFDLTCSVGSGRGNVFAKYDRAPALANSVRTTPFALVYQKDSWHHVYMMASADVYQRAVQADDI